MDRISHLKRPEVLKELKQYKSYKGLSEKKIVDKLGQKDLSSLRKELSRLETRRQERSKTSSVTTPVTISTTPVITPVYKSSLFPGEIVDYLKTMSYTDINQLCQTNKDLNSICHNNNLFRMIIYKKSGLEIKNEPVADLMS